MIFFFGCRSKTKSKKNQTMIMHYKRSKNHYCYEMVTEMLKKKSINIAFKSQFALFRQNVTVYSKNGIGIAHIRHCRCHRCPKFLSLEMIMNANLFQSTFNILVVYAIALTVSHQYIFEMIFPIFLCPCKKQTHFVTICFGEFNFFFLLRSLKIIDYLIRSK